MFSNAPAANATDQNGQTAPFVASLIAGRKAVRRSSHPPYAGRVLWGPSRGASSFLHYMRFSGSLNHAASLLFSCLTGARSKARSLPRARFFSASISSFSPVKPFRNSLSTCAAVRSPAREATGTPRSSQTVAQTRASITISLGSKNRPGYNIPSSVGKPREPLITRGHRQQQSTMIVCTSTGSVN
jgi:hypothetical protein